MLLLAQYFTQRRKATTEAAKKELKLRHYFQRLNVDLTRLVCNDGQRYFSETTFESTNRVGILKLSASVALIVFGFSTANSGISIRLLASDDGGWSIRRWYC